MNLIEEISLPNSLTLQVWDRSRRIAVDTTKVELRVSVTVPVRPEYFSDPAQYDKVRRVFGQEITYEYGKERTFVDRDEKDAVLMQLLADFKRDSLPYIAKPSFPSRFVLSRLRDIEQHSYKYRHILSRR